MPTTDTPYTLRNGKTMLNYSVNLNQNQPDTINGMQETVASSVGKTMQAMGGEQPQAQMQPVTASDNPNVAKPLA